MFFCFFAGQVYSQIQIDSLNELNFPLFETSGLIELDGHFITHNDSGDDPILYELNSFTGEVIRQVLVSNAHHIDWEDICRDEEYIYVSDSGNNDGDRTDLKVYKIQIDDFFNTPNESVTAEVIHFAYADQTDFSDNQNDHNFDAEALISIGDSLYIFTKNRGDFRTNIYPLNKTPGDYLLVKTDSFNSQGLVTGATYIPDSSQVVLVGYTPSHAFVIELSNLQNTQFSAADRQQHSIPINGSFQVESIAWKEGRDFLITTEGNFSGQAALYCLQLDINVSTERQPISYPIQVFPNPCHDRLFIKSPFKTSIRIYDQSGKLQLISSEQEINVTDLINGLYWLKTQDQHGRTIESRSLIVLH